MKILVLSDSHAGLSFMRRCIRTVKPDALVHLGDYYDDGAAMAEELQKCGVTLLMEENRITVPAGQLKAPEVPVNGHNDHRIVMAMAVLLTRLGGAIEGAEAVAKSMPDFFEKLSSLGIEVKGNEVK